MLVCVTANCAASQPPDFVRRSDDTLLLNGKPFFFLGANAYYLLEQSARGDSTTVKALFATASNLNMNVVRTWAFFDSPDSLNPAVVQFRPGRFNESALRALDYVIYQARLHNIRLLFPLVNSWDEYGGMNQYVRWRAQIATAAYTPAQRFSPTDLQKRIESGVGRSYQYAVSSQFGHDDFYIDDVIKGWYKNYVATILNRINTYTNVRYKDDPYIFGWELANEPRSSDATSQLVYNWIVEISTFVKSIDSVHLIGTGEEGFDISSTAYSMPWYNNQRWLFDGTAGVSFAANSSIASIDFCSCHLYPEVWNLPKSAGNAWIRDHIRIARAMRKPMVIGEYAVREQQPATYESWLTTSLLDGASGSMVWQVLEGTRTDREGFGFSCLNNELLCSRLRTAGDQFIRKSNARSLPSPQTFSLHQNYPNPFNGLTTISYALPFEAFVELTVFSIAGQRLSTIVNGVQSSGERKELFDAQGLASGTYFYRLIVGNPTFPHQQKQSETKKSILLR